MAKVTVDADNLWFILQGYKGDLDNECKTMPLEKWRKYGFYFQEYETIKQMEQQIREVI